MSPQSACRCRRSGSGGSKCAAAAAARRYWAVLLPPAKLACLDDRAQSTRLNVVRMFQAARGMRNFQILRVRSLWRLQVLGHLGGAAAGGDVKVVAKRDAADEGAADAIPLAGTPFNTKT